MEKRIPTKVQKTKNELSYHVPYCKKCKQDMKWKMTFRIGLYDGGVALYEYEKCKKTKEILIKPTAAAKKKYQNFLQNVRGTE